MFFWWLPKCFDLIGMCVGLLHIVVVFLWKDGLVILLKIAFKNYFITLYWQDIDCSQDTEFLVHTDFSDVLVCHDASELIS